MTSLTGSQGATGYKAGKSPKGYKLNQVQNFTPEQLQLLQQGIGMVGPDSFLSKLAGGDEEMFNQLEKPALRQFSGLMGGLSSRFSGGGGGQGAMSSRNSSGFQNAAYGASSDFAQQLQSQRMGLQRNAVKDLSEISNMLMGQRPYENYLTKKKPKWWQSMLSEFGESAARSGGEAIFGGGGNDGGGMDASTMAKYAQMAAQYGGGG